MTQDLVTIGSKAMQIFSDLTMPQAIVISAGIAAVAYVTESTIEHGLALDFDFSNRRFCLAPTRECIDRPHNIQHKH